MPGSQTERTKLISKKKKSLDYMVEEPKTKVQTKQERKSSSASQGQDSSNTSNSVVVHPSFKPHRRNTTSAVVDVVHSSFEPHRRNAIQGKEEDKVENVKTLLEQALLYRSQNPEKWEKRQHEIIKTGQVSLGIAQDEESFLNEYYKKIDEKEAKYEEKKKQLKNAV